MKTVYISTLTKIYNLQFKNIEMSTYKEKTVYTLSE